MTVPTLDHTTVAAPASRRPVGLVSDLAVCVWIPLFALRAEEQRRPGYAARPLAVLDPDDSRRLWQVSPSARHAGVKPGTTISQAIGLCPTLALCEADPVYYDERFARLLHDLSNVSPVVEPGDLSPQLRCPAPALAVGFENTGWVYVTTRTGGRGAVRA